MMDRFKWFHGVIGLTLIISLFSWMAVVAQDDLDTHAQVELVIETLWNDGDLETVADFVAEDVTVYLPPSLGVDPPFSGIEGYQMNVAGWRAGLPDMAVEILAIVADDMGAAARVNITGSQTEEFFGIPPTNADLEFGANILYVFDETGLIVEEWWEWDTVLELIQLGLFVPPGAEATE